MKLAKIFGCLLIGSIVCTGCAHEAKIDDRAEIKLDGNDETPIKVTPFKTDAGFAEYKSAAKDAVTNGSRKVQWIQCTPRNAEKSRNKGEVAVAATALIFHRFESGFSKQDFCKGWVGQVFLKHGLQVVAVNRPSYVESVGSDDLSGADSIAAVRSVVESNKIANVVGLWGYDTGTIAATFYAKKFPQGINWLILGGGIYDLEATLKSTVSQNLKNAAMVLEKSEGATFLETRSIAWDFSGLPKTMVIYHASDDTFAPVGQANSFNDQLRTSEFKVFKKEIAVGGHDIPWKAHMKIIEQSLNQVLPKEK